MSLSRRNPGDKGLSEFNETRLHFNYLPGVVAGSSYYTYCVDDNRFGTLAYCPYNLYWGKLGYESSNCEEARKKT